MDDKSAAARADRQSVRSSSERDSLGPFESGRPHVRTRPAVWAKPVNLTCCLGGETLNIDTLPPSRLFLSLLFSLKANTGSYRQCWVLRKSRISFGSAAKEEERTACGLDAPH